MIADFISRSALKGEVNPSKFVILDFQRQEDLPDQLHVPLHLHSP
jgi:hypothetical protein